MIAAQSGKDGDLFVQARSAVVDGLHPAYISIYFCTITLAATLAGIGIRKAADRAGFDRKVAILNYNSWFYLLNGDPPPDAPLQPKAEAVLIPAVVGEVLFNGILVDFAIDKNGVLDAIVLTEVSRRKIGAENPLGDDETRHDKYYKINAEHVVLKYSTIANLAVTRLWLPEEDEFEDDWNESCSSG